MISAARVLPHCRLRQPPRSSLALPSQTPRTAAARASRPPLPPSAPQRALMIAVYISSPPPPISRHPRGCTQQPITHRQGSSTIPSKQERAGREAGARSPVAERQETVGRSSIGWDSRLVSSEEMLGLSLIPRFLSGGVVPGSFSLWTLEVCSWNLQSLYSIKLSLRFEVEIA